MERTKRVSISGGGRIVRLLSVAVLVLGASLIFGVTHARAALSPFASDTGDISVSIDAAGTNNPAGTTIRVQKNAGATVRAAYLFTAVIPFGYRPTDGDVTLNGTPINWDPATFVTSNFGEKTAESDVTAIVKPIVDAAPAGIVNFAISEGPNTAQYDGEELVVVLNDPTVTSPGSVIIMYGSQSTTGDMFNVALSDPVNKSNPNFGLDLSLGIAFSYDVSAGCCGQDSQVNVNGQRMTSSAGGQDDCRDAVAGNYNPCGNGTLITAGGIGDLNDNPPNPFATSANCVGVKGPSPVCDDELYSLLPFVNNGDTSLNFNTLNPSNDDDIFTAVLNVKASAAIVGAGIVLGPVSATDNVGDSHTLTATVQDTNGNPVSGATVTFTDNSGPNAGLTGTGVTNAQGKATFTYSSSTAGTDTWTASFTDATGTKRTSNEATKTWVATTGDNTPPTCALTGVIAGPPKQIQVTVQDTGSGLASVQVTSSSNASTVVPPFTSGTTSPVTITSTKVDQTQSSQLALTVKDVAGNTTTCDPIVPPVGINGSVRGLTARTFAHLAASQSKVTIVNSGSASRLFTIRVNDKRLTVTVAAGESRRVDVASAMRRDHRNTITVSARSDRSSAMVSITS